MISNMVFSALNLAEIDLISDEITGKLIQISRNEESYKTRYLHIPFLRNTNICIHSVKNQYIKNSNYLLTDDNLAHQLSFFGKDFPEIFFRSVKHMIILPEFIRSSEHFLTNIYLPDQGILAFYMVPFRLHLDAETFQENRMTGQKIITPGLLHNTARTISRYQSERSSEKNSVMTNAMHKFLHPAANLTGREIFDMQELSDFFANSISRGDEIP